MTAARSYFPSHVVAVVMVALRLVHPANSFSFVLPHCGGAALLTTAERSGCYVPLTTRQRRNGSHSHTDGGRVAASSAVRRRPSMGVSSVAIETVAKGLLNLVLANPQQATVDCRVSSSALELVRGNLEEAAVDGLNWTTPMGMTMRKIALTLNGMKIKTSEIFLGKITFKCPAVGRAVLDLNVQDFGNFLVHPLMGTASLPSGDFVFSREGITLDTDRGRASFTGMWHGQPVVMEACQPQRFGKIYVRVAQRGTLTDLGIQKLSDEMTDFFKTVELDLDGTAVRFQDMYHGYNSLGEPSLRITVGVVVHRVPNPKNMKF